MADSFKSKCNKCGQEVWVHTSLKPPNKTYECNSERRNDFHSKTCSGRSSSSSGPATATLPETQPQVQTAQDSYYEQQEREQMLEQQQSPKSPPYITTPPNPIAKGKIREAVVKEFVITVSMSKNYQKIEASIIVEPHDEDYRILFQKIYNNLYKEVKPRIDVLAKEMR